NATCRAGCHQTGSVACRTPPTTGMPVTTIPRVIFGRNGAIGGAALAVGSAKRSVNVAVLSDGSRSGSSRLRAEAVATRSPVRLTVPQIVTFELVPGETQATSHVSVTPVPAQPGPRSA